MEGATIPFNLQDLLSKRPSSLEQPFTRGAYDNVDSLHICWMHVQYGDWGTDEDWELLEPLFDNNGVYIG